MKLIIFNSLEDAYLINIKKIFTRGWHALRNALPLAFIPLNPAFKE